MKIGDKIPEFSAIDHIGNKISSETLKGKNIVMFFYPKDYSPVCTAEACGFRDNYSEFKNYNCELIGISADSDTSHNGFAKKHNLQFPLISDKGNQLRKLFGVKSDIFGLLPGRETFLVDTEGTVRLIFNSQMNANSHIEKTLELLKKYFNNQGNTEIK